MYFELFSLIAFNQKNEPIISIAFISIISMERVKVTVRRVTRTVTRLISLNVTCLSPPTN